MNAVVHLEIDIDMTPHLSHPLVRGFIDPTIELSESHIHAIEEAIMYARRLRYEEKETQRGPKN